jgi:SNF2 family DNA or RNA helicase
MSRNWTPHPYQEEAISFALGQEGSGLMLDPGLGKTAITLACISLLIQAKEIRKTLVVAPLRVCKSVWPTEGQKWSDFNHLKIANLCNLKAVERAVLLKRDYHVYLINPESLVKVLPLLGDDFDLLVLDESTKFKDTQTQRFKALKPLLYKFKRRMILTGTPVPNGVADLFGQMYVVDLGNSLGKYITHFRMEFMHQSPGDLYNYYLNKGAEEMIYARVKGKLMRMDAGDHIAMPTLVNNFIEVELPTAELKKNYKQLENDFYSKIEGEDIATFNTAAVGVKLRQMANGFLYTDIDTDRRVIDLHDEKLDALEELVEEMQGRPLLVAYEFQADADRILKRLPQAVDLGKVKNVDIVIAKFNRGEIPLLIAHPASAGHGLNLQEACSTLCWFGITWNLELYLQFIARVWRQGQAAAAVIVHHIVCKETKDEDVMKALESKDRTQTNFNNAIKSHHL